MSDLFQIGWAPIGWDGLIRKAQSASVKPELLLKAGLVVPRKDGKGYYDRFRGRLMFPIHNPAGQVVGFGARILNNDPNAPKYLNSPETAIYQKSRILYGLHQSKTAIQKENRIILVEGYLDLIRMVMSGFRNTVATSGTALTEGQAQLLSRYAKDAVLVFDGDSAGLNAASRGVEVLVGTGFSVRVTPLPMGTDPDTFLIRNGKTAMEESIRSAKPFIDFFIDQARGKSGLVTVSDQAALAKSILSVVSKVADPIERNLLIKETGEKLGLDEAVLLQQLAPPQPETVSGSGPSSPKPSARLAAEEGILRLLMENTSQWAPSIFQHLNPEHFQNRDIREIVEDIRNAPLPPNGIYIPKNQRPETAQFLSSLFSQGPDKLEDRSQFALDCILRIRQEDIQESIDRIRREIQNRQKQKMDVTQLTQEYLNQKKLLEKTKSDIITQWKKQVEKVGKNYYNKEGP
ncbi:MAG TPA: toprim domain-containing protein, partial [bacterium]